MPTWIALGLVLDWGTAQAVHLASIAYLASFDLALESSWSVVGFILLIGPVTVTLPAVWFIHAAVLPSLAFKRLGGRRALRLLGLGVAFAVVGTGVAFVSFVLGEVLFRAALDAAYTESFSPALIRMTEAAVFTGPAAVAGACAGAALCPLLRAALPRSARVGFWTNVAAGAFAAALPIFAVSSIGGLNPSPPMSGVIASTALILAFLPHLWIVGRAVRRAASAPAT